jgi:metal-sulfur cluster biosynthetic enzyme
MEFDWVQLTTNPAQVCYLVIMNEVLNGEQVKRDVLKALKVVRDPEIPVNIVDLGLIYKLDVSDGGEVGIEMTLTSMGCPVQDMIQADAELACINVEGVKNVNVAFVWSPPWSPERMSEDGKKQLQMLGFNV